MLVDKVTSSTRLVFNKNSSQAVSDGVHEWEICCFMVEMFNKYAGDKVMELVLQLKEVPSTGCLRTIILFITFHALPGRYLAVRLLTSLSTWLLYILKSTTPSPQLKLVSLSSMVVTDHSRCFSLLPSSADGKHVKSCVSSLTINSFNMAVALFNKKLYSPAAGRRKLSQAVKPGHS
jgi:hypothetical protein